MRRTKSLAVAGLLAALLIVAIFALTNSVNAKAGEATAAQEGEGLVAAIPGTFLTGPNVGEPLTIALNFIRANREALQMSEAEVSGLVVKDQYLSQKSGITHIYLAQTHNGIEVYNGVLNVNIAWDGSVINVGNRAVPNLTAAIQAAESQLTAVEAVEKAAEHLRLELAQGPVVEEVIGGAAQAVVISDSGISRNPISARLIYQPTADGSVRLAWDLVIYELSGSNWWNIWVDAVTGQELDRNNFIASDNWGSHQGNGEVGGAIANDMLNVPLLASVVPSSYLVYAMPVESPNHTTPAPPADARTTEISPWLDAPTASPLGWHATTATSWTDTQGNNVDAHKGATRYDCGATLECTTPIDLTMDPTIPDNRDAALVNLFYWNNIIHDVTYEYGFNEVAGNFQNDNFALGGLGNDRVNANAQLGTLCNAFFGTPSDGSQPNMDMYVCPNVTPNRDGSLESTVMVHEYGHGVSNRLTGGPSNVGCLGNSEQMGEGWSDWLGLMLTMEPGDMGVDPRGIGTWLFGQGPNGPGIRPTPYSTDMIINPTTYGDIGGLAVPHGVGYAWATMVWDMTWGLVDEYGYNADFYDNWNTGGNNLAIQLVLDGMKLQPCSPGFVDGRDAILLADQNLTGGQNQCLIWEAFAGRGLGFSANQGSSGSATDGTEAFDMPVFCQFLGANPQSLDICAGDLAEYNVTLGNAFTPNITMSADGNPAGTTASFSPNPVTTVPSTTTLTINNTASAAAGDYTITITGTDSTLTTSNFMVGLTVFDALPAAPALTTPANGATDIDRQNPSFEWSAVAQGGSYLLEVDDNSDFSSILYSATTDGTSHTSSLTLDPLTTYYWRVTAANSCGAGSTSSVFSFTTESIPPILLVDDDDNVPDVRGAYTAALDALGAAYDIWDTGNSDNEPNVAGLAPYQAIIWFTGDEFGGFAGPGPASEAVLGNFLDAGNCMFISSQDYRYDRNGQTPFMTNYLGVGTSSDDDGDYTVVTGSGSIFGGLGPYTLDYGALLDYSDRLSPGGTAELAFDGANTNDAAVNKDNGTYKTTFLGFPWEAINTAPDREEVLDAFLEWCFLPTGTLDHSPNLIEDTVAMGESVTHTLTVSNTGPGPIDFVVSSPAAWASATPSGGTLDPGESMDLSVVFDTSATAGVGDYTSTLDFTGTYTNTPVPVDLVLHVVSPSYNVYMPAIRGGAAAASSPTAALPWFVPLLGFTAVAGLGYKRRALLSILRDKDK